MNSVRIAGDKETELEFDVSIRGLTQNAKPQVRFVIEGAAADGFDITINCSRTPHDKWVAKVPRLSINESRRDFRVEVIADGYYFCPVNGVLDVDHAPQVTAEAITGHIASRRPEVHSSFSTVRQLMEFQLLGEGREFSEACAVSSKIFEKTGSLLRSMSGHKRSKVSSKAVVNMLQNVHEAVTKLEKYLYKS